MKRTIYIEATPDQIEDIVGELKEDGETTVEDITIVFMEISPDDDDGASYPNARIAETES